jgi:hypothetical protein
MINRVFKCEFSDGCVCTITASETPPKRQRVNWKPFECKFSKKPTPVIFPDYMKWVLGVNKVLADWWKAQYIYGIVAPGGTVHIWGFAPGIEPTELGLIEATIETEKPQGGQDA